MGPWEIPVMPAWEIPLRVDEYGNGLPGVRKPPKDSYSELHRRTKPRTTSTRGEETTLSTWTPPTGMGFPLTDSENSPLLKNPSGFRIRQVNKTSPEELPQEKPNAVASAHLLEDDPEAKDLVEQLTRADPTWDLTDPWSPFNPPLLGNVPLLPMPNELSPAEQALINELMISLTVNPPTLGGLPIDSTAGVPHPTLCSSQHQLPMKNQRPLDPADYLLEPEENSHTTTEQEQGREDEAPIQLAQTRTPDKRSPRKKHV